MWPFVLIIGGVALYALSRLPALQQSGQPGEGSVIKQYTITGKNTKRTVTPGLIASFILLSIYFTAVSLISGWDFAIQQFNKYWYFIVSLAAGFGIQIGLYAYLKKTVTAHAAKMSGKVVATTGTTSTVAMISCCAHYLATILPVIGISGFLSIVGQYQIELFWFGLASNLFGISYLVRKINGVTNHV